MESLHIRRLCLFFGIVVLFIPCSYAMHESRNENTDSEMNCCSIKDALVEFSVGMVTCCILCVHELNESAQKTALAQVVKEEQEKTVVPENCNVMGEYCVFNEPGKDYGNNA